MITLKRIDEKNIDLLKNLLQLYLHDVSLYFPITLNYQYILLNHHIHIYKFLNSK